MSNLTAQEPSYWILDKSKGLPSNTVYEIIQDEEGIVWMTTSRGLVKYNSIEMSHLTGNDLIDNEMLTLKIGPLGKMWATNLAKEVVVVEEDSLRKIHFKDMPEHLRNVELEFVGNDVFIVVNVQPTSDKVYKPYRSAIYQIPYTEFNDTITLAPYLYHVSEVDGSRVFVCEDKKEWYIIYDVLGEFNSSQRSIEHVGNAQNDIIPELVKESLYDWGVRILNFRSFKNGIKIFYGVNDLVYWDAATSYKVSCPKYINDVTIINDQIWLFTREGVYVLDRKTGDRVSKPMYTNYAFSTGMKDQEGNIWLGLLDKGIIIIPNIELETFSNLREDPESVFSIATWNDQVVFGQRESLKTISKNLEVESIHIPDNQGRVLSLFEKANIQVVGTDKSTFLRQGGSDFIKVPLSSATKDVIIDSRDNLWIGNHRALKFQEKGKYDQPNALSLIRDRTACIYEDKLGNIWAGTINGLYQVDLAHYIHQIDLINENVLVRDITAVSDSLLAVATCNQGVFLINSNTAQIHKKLNLPHDDCFNVLRSDSLALWIGGDKGIIYYDLVTDSTSTIVDFDGLPSNQINGLIIKDNLVWVATGKGVVRFPKKIVEKELPKVNLSLANININGKEIFTPSDKNRFKHNQNNIIFNVEAISFYLRGEIEFKYRLLPNEQWQTTHNSNIQFLSLEPGDYTLEVGISNPVPTTGNITYDFIVRKPWSRLIWVQVLAFLGLVLIATKSIIFFQKRKEKEGKMRHDFENKLNDLKMTALQSQMNPHFIFNCLNTIQSFMLEKNTEVATDGLVLFSRLIRNVFLYSKEKAISLEKELDFLNVYIELEKMRFGSELEVDIQMSELVKENLFALKVPPLLIQPIVENAFQHGLLHSDRKKKLSLELEMEGNYLKCTVTDNGVGRDRSIRYNEWQKKNKRLSGMDLTQERLKMLTENMSSGVNVLEVLDRIDEDTKKSVGTIVVLRIHNNYEF